MSSDARGGWETWEWDETLFAGAAPHYVQGRTPYAPGLAEALAEGMDLDGRGRLLDLGCGPGVVALSAAHLFESVVGLDPDAGMLAEAARLAAEAGVGNASWVKLRAEELPAGLGIFKVATLAASFHWMDRPKVAAALRAMIERGGAVVQVDAPGYRPDASGDGADLPHPSPPHHVVVEVRRRYLGPDTRAGQGIRNSSPSGEDEVFRSAGWPPGHRVVVSDGRVLERTIDDLVADSLSSSGGAPHLFGDRLDDFVSDLRSALAAASPSGLFSIGLPDNVLTFWRRA